MKTVISLLTLLLFVTFASWAGPKTVVVETKLISQTISGTTTGTSRRASISGDGRYISFQSSHSGLLENDTNDRTDVILHDTQTGINTLISSSYDEGISDNGAGNSSMSADGRYIVFESSSTNIVENDTNDEIDIFLHDTTTKVNTIISLGYDGEPAIPSGGINPSISANGRYIVFSSSATNLVENFSDVDTRSNLFLHDAQTNTTVLVVNSGLIGIGYPSAVVSNDGKVVFRSDGTDIVPNDNNGSSDVFLYDITTNTTIRLSVAADGSESTGYFSSSEPRISADGRHVIFKSSATDLVGNTPSIGSHIFLHNTDDGVNTRVNGVINEQHQTGSCAYASISPDGRYVFYHARLYDNMTGDMITPREKYGFVYDIDTSTSTQLDLAVNDNGISDSFTSNSYSINSSSGITSGGKYVVFDTGSDNLVDLANQEGTNIFRVELAVVVQGTAVINLMPGINMISLPNQPEDPYTARSLIEQIHQSKYPQDDGDNLVPGGTVTDVNWLIRYDLVDQKFRSYVWSIDNLQDDPEDTNPSDGIAQIPNPGFDIEGGQGYIVNVSSARSVQFIGTVWDGVLNPLAPSLEPKTPQTWAFILLGQLPPQLTSQLDNHSVRVTNLQTGRQLAETTGLQSQFRLPMVDSLQESIVHQGDLIRVEVCEPSGQRVADAEFVIGTEELATAYRRVNLQYNPIPDLTRLQQNYPNPFNPETWIPFDLSQEGEVKITIYDLAGHQVRLLPMGRKPAGIYHSQQRSAYWDGKTETGESVASGVYFYSIQTEDYRETRRMVILK